MPFTYCYDDGMSVLIGALAAAAGAFWWFLFEYVLHRWAFHELRGRGIGSREHLRHHVTAGWSFDALMLLAWIGVIGVGVGWAALVSWLSSLQVGAAFGAGWVLGYFCYEYHHAQAHLRAPRNRWEVWLRKHHFHHHFGHPLANHGVTISLWDHVFGTYETPGRVRVPRRLAMRWLVDDHGEIRREFAADYELVGSAAPPKVGGQSDEVRAFANLAPIP